MKASVLALAISHWSSSAAAQSAEPEAGARAPAGNEYGGVIIVTAQKRSERLQDVPAPVTAISGDTLINQNQTSLRDYYTSVPGLSLSPDFRGGARIAIRGITADLSANPTVGIVIDDLPTGSSTTQGGGSVAVELNPADIERVEILRGPQGTLYGASSIGGLIKFVTVEPTFDEFKGHAQAGITSTKGGDDLGYNLRGSVNVPISPELAVRASGFFRSDPGYIDNVRTGKDDVNDREAKGGRVSALWRPSNDFSIQLGALIQKTSSDGYSAINTTLPDLQQFELTGSNFYDRTIQIYSANMSGTIGNVDLTSITGLSYSKIDAVNDYSRLVANAVLRDNRDTRRFSQEVRAVVPVGDHIEWMVGGFYTDEKSDALQRLDTINPASGDVTGTIVIAPFPSTYKEHSFFTNVLFKLSDKFDVQLGARQAEIRQVFELASGATVFPTQRTRSSAFTYLVNPRYRFSDNLMAYARIASGYRPGGANQPLVPSPAIPIQYDPDVTTNYEIGLKGDVLDKRLTFELSLYYIDWDDIQVLVREANANFIANVGTAQSKGIEVSLGAQPIHGMSIKGWVAYNKAEVAETFPSTQVFAQAGDRLPFSSRFTANISVDQEFSLSNSAMGYVGGTFAHVGRQFGNFTANAATARTALPAYERFDVRAGVKFEGGWGINAFVSNLTDKRGRLGSNIPGVNPNVFIIDPRTIGLSIAKEF